MIATLECHAWRLIVTVSIIWPVVAGARNSIRGIQHEEAKAKAKAKALLELQCFLEVLGVRNH